MITRFLKSMGFTILAIVGCAFYSGCESVGYALAEWEAATDKNEWQVNTGALATSSFNLTDLGETPGVQWDYTIQNPFSVMFRPSNIGDLKGLQTIRFHMRSDQGGSLALILTEADGSNYTKYIALKTDTWTNVSLKPSQFEFDKDTKDENGRIDPDQITRLALVDISGLSGAAGKKRSLAVAGMELEIESQSAPAQPSDLKVTPNSGGDDKTAEIYRMDMKTGKIIRLTFNKFYENHVHLSPDGKKYLFTVFTKDLDRDGEVGESDMDSSEVGIMDVDGTNYRLLTRNAAADFGAVWGPQSKRILFTTNRFNKQFDLATINADGTGFKRLTNTPKINEVDPHWMGTTMVFNRWWPGTIPNPGIWKMNSDGTGDVQLTNPKFPKPSSGLPFGDMDPKLSPDGKKIAFERHQSNKGNFGYGDFDLYVMNSDGSNLKEISNNDSADAVPTWSPDGKKLAFWIVTEDLKDALDLFTINPDGSARTKVTREPENLEEEMPSWVSNDILVFSGKRD